MEVKPITNAGIKAANLLAVLVCGTFAIWLATPAQPIPRSAINADLPGVEGPRQAGAEPPHESRARPLTEQVQELLARGGCPGWMALAGEPELLTPPPATRQDEPGSVVAIAFQDPVSVEPEPTEREPNEAEPTEVEDDGVAATISDPADPLPEEDASSAPTESESTEDDLLLGAEDLLLDRSDLLHAPAARPAASGEDLLEADALLDARDDLLAPDPTPGAASSPAPATPDEPPREALPEPAPTTPTPIVPAPATPAAPQKQAASDPHAALFAESVYPSAETCRPCHETIYDEWSISGHAYAAVSPMFHRFEQTIHQLTHGTIGYFCYRCHSPVGTALCVPRDMPLWNAPQVAQEGVTCVACHRINENYGKTNGERHIVPGDIYAPVYGTIGGSGVAETVADKQSWKVKTSPQDKGPGQPIHQAGICFPQLGRSDFCASCHQVAVHPGIKLEVVWEQYRASPACKKGVSCQDCHMGRIPGVPSGYARGPAAVVNNKPVHPDRKHANHIFYGPGYSIAHPGLFPWNPKAKRWTPPEWLQFDWRAGWGTEEFERSLESGEVAASFPPAWDNIDDRYDAREIIEANQKKLAKKRHIRQQVFENSSHVDGPFFEKNPSRGQDLRLHYLIVNANDGHNLPTASLGAQPQLWANVALIDPCGRRVWESGYTDRHGDLADIHSLEVRRKRLPFDWQLFNLQTMFLITGAVGTDREFPLPVNVDIDQLPFIRPGVQPISVINHPPLIRMEGRSLPPLGSRRIPYKIPAEALQTPGRYRLAFRMRNRAEPIYFMRFCNSTPEMMRAMNEGILDVHASCVEFTVR